MQPTSPVISFGVCPVGIGHRIRRTARRVRGRFREVFAGECEHRNTHRPLAYLEMCWQCDAKRIDGGAWFRGVR